MTTASLLLYTILLMAVGYGQLVESQSNLEAILIFAGRLGVDYSNPGKSCRDIYEYNMASRGRSGYYWIKTDQVYKVYCDMELSCGGIRGGWMRIANLDTSQGDNCPNGWSLRTTPQPLCRGSGNKSGCYSTFFPNNRTEYTSICGKLRGYQQGSPSAFIKIRHDPSINGPYLDGVSITVGGDEERKHVWSYAAGFTKTYNDDPYKTNCPCAKFPGDDPPIFVKDHYYCESGASSYRPGLTQFFGSDPLWDGKGCTHGDNCCSTLGAPWFHRQFTQAEKGPIEVRICRDEGYDNEAILVEQVELYVQ
ncbi:uncharacterized protein [Dysidea avara]|uniref:uncharacterized protein n=1 Tax=Dysidea avara TaxID=196820 RepID=UPI003329E98F